MRLRFLTINVHGHKAMNFTGANSKIEIQSEIIETIIGIQIFLVTKQIFPLS